MVFLTVRFRAWPIPLKNDAGWSSPVAREAHNLEVTGSNPVPATLRKPSRNQELDYLPTVGSAA